jgi:Succinylglutamate desuccinylase / Aspartoacylase family
VDHPPAVKESSRPETAILVERLARSGQAAGFEVEVFGRVEGIPLLALTKSGAEGAPHLYLSAGIHGDEPAPPRALLQLLDEGFFAADCHWHVCPLLNPAGMDRGTRENPGGLDLNRDYREPRSSEIRAHVGWLRRQPAFDLTLCLHEDWEATGFYLYELNPDRRPSLAGPIVAAVRGVCPIDPAAIIDGRPASGGVIRPDADPAKRELWPEAIYLRVHHTRLGYTLETPSALPLERRVSAQVVAVSAARREFLLRR